MENKSAQELIDEIEDFELEETRSMENNDGGLFVLPQSKLEQISWKILNNTFPLRDVQ